MHAKCHFSSSSKKSKNIDNNSVKSDNKEIPLRNRLCLFLTNIVWPSISRPSVQYGLHWERQLWLLEFKRITVQNFLQKCEPVSTFLIDPMAITWKHVESTLHYARFTKFCANVRFFKWLNIWFSIIVCDSALLHRIQLSFLDIVFNKLISNWTILWS